MHADPSKKPVLQSFKAFFVPCFFLWHQWLCKHLNQPKITPIAIDEKTTLQRTPKTA
jgi:hypothetical protein